ncbi:leucine-rich repeat, cysteine-containing subtype protein [Tanacetum coccineum]
MALTKVGDEVLDLVIPYIYNVDDQNSISLVSHNFYEIDSITRKRVTVHTLYYPNPASLSNRFPFIESLTLKGPPFHFTHAYHYAIRITPFKTLARTRGKDLRSLKIKNCKGFLTDGLRHVSNYCKQIGKCYLSKLGDAFRYAFRLEHFGGENLDKESDLIRKLELLDFLMDHMCQCSLFKMCPYLEVLSTSDKCGDKGLQVIGKFCKKLCKLTHYGLVTHVGPIALAKGCTNLEYLNVSLRDISNEALECVGKHMKNLRNFYMHLDKKDGTTYKPLDNGLLDIGLLDNGI